MLTKKGDREWGGREGTLVKVGGFVWTKRREVICELEGHYESDRGINNTPLKTRGKFTLGRQ